MAVPELLTVAVMALGGTERKEKFRNLMCIHKNVGSNYIKGKGTHSNHDR